MRKEREKNIKTLIKVCGLKIFDDNKRFQQAYLRMFNDYTAVSFARTVDKKRIFIEIGKNNFAVVVHENGSYHIF